LLKVNQNFRFIAATGAGGLPGYLFAGLFGGFACRRFLPGFTFDGFKGTSDDHLSLIAAMFAGTHLAEGFLEGLVWHLLWFLFNLNRFELRWPPMPKMVSPPAGFNIADFRPLINIF
jgi:hypothetical protein